MYQWRKLVKSRKFVEYTADMDEFVSPEASNGELKFELMEKQIGNMNPCCRQILNLVLKGKTGRQIFAILGLKDLISAKNKIFYAKKQLREMMMNDPLFREIYE